MSVKRFLIVPGWVWSAEDGDRHYIGSRQLMQLHGVRPEECVVADHSTIYGALLGYDLDTLLELTPSRSGFYHPVGEAERRQYPLQATTRSHK